MTNTITPLICSECGEGNYFFSAATGEHDCTNPTCDHSVTRGDIILDDGERLTLGGGYLLSVASAD